MKIRTRTCFNLVGRVERQWEAAFGFRAGWGWPWRDGKYVEEDVWGGQGDENVSEI